ncbi:hypothetical protein AMECASPLE_031386 [Ameca splendens]|uniref:Uncharacterized protein n=1 Tax=Ameca splendens TaxID=208324 RepID=A0ABV1ACN3_9TELE
MIQKHSPGVLSLQIKTPRERVGLQCARLEGGQAGRRKARGQEKRVWRTELSSGEEPLRPLRVKVELLLSELVASNNLPMKLIPAWRMWELPANT